MLNRVIVELFNRVDVNGQWTFFCHGPVCGMQVHGYLLMVNRLIEVVLGIWPINYKSSDTGHGTSIYPSYVLYLDSCLFILTFESFI